GRGVGPVGRRGRHRPGPAGADRPGPGAAAGFLGGAAGRLPPAQPVLLLPLLLLPAQLLAGHGAEVAGAGRGRLHAAAGVHGLPAVQGAVVALRELGGPALLPRVSLLARSVLIWNRQDAKSAKNSR